MVFFSQAYPFEPNVVLHNLSPPNNKTMSFVAISQRHTVIKILTQTLTVAFITYSHDLISEIISSCVNASLIAEDISVLLNSGVATKQSIVLV